MKNKKLCPITISNYFYKKFGENNIMKLNFLTYHSYCWYKSLTKKSLTFEKPVITKYGIFFNCLLHFIFNTNKEKYIKDIIPYKNFTPIDEEVSELLDKMWKLYGEKDSIYLSALCQKDKDGLLKEDYIPNKTIYENYILKGISPKKEIKTAKHLHIKK